MHGRLKVRTTEEQQLIKQKEQQKKLQAYRAGMKQILSTRKEIPYNATSFGICSQLLSLNPDIYTLWNYRKEVALQEIDQSKSEGETGEEKLISFLENEMKLTEQCLLANPKSYGSWHHRYWILENHPKPNWDKEFALCTKYLTMDDRNFHCWDYRRLILRKIELDLESELKFSVERININFSNYSSWHYRSTLRNLNAESLEKEIELVENAVFTDPTDSSAWFYLRWILSNPEVNDKHRQHLLERMNQLIELEPDCKWIYMAKCWLTGSLLLCDKEHLKDRIECYRKLGEIDPMRRGQYDEYLKVAQESALENQ